MDDDTPQGDVDAPETGTETPPAEPSTPPVGEPAFPANTPVAEMTDAQAAAYWKEQSRKHEGRAKDNHAELEKLRRGQLSDQEQAVANARDEGRSEALREASLTIVAAKLEAAGVGVDDIADLDLSKFLTPDGEVDAAKVSATCERFAKRSRIPTGSADAGPQGDTPAEPSIDEQIAKATKEGDITTVIALNNQKLAMSAGLS